MDWHVFVALNVFVCVSFCCHPGNSLATKIKKESTSNTSETVGRVKRSAQLKNGPIMDGQVNFQISGINLPDIVSGISKNIHNVIDSIRNPMSIGVVTLETNEDSHEGSEQLEYHNNNRQTYSGNRKLSPYENPPPSPPPYENLPSSAYGHHPSHPNEKYPHPNEHHPPPPHGNHPQHPHGNHPHPSQHHPQHPHGNRAHPNKHHPPHPHGNRPHPNEHHPPHPHEGKPPPNGHHPPHPHEDYPPPTRHHPPHPHENHPHSNEYHPPLQYEPPPSPYNHQLPSPYDPPYTCETNGNNCKNTIKNTHKTKRPNLSHQPSYSHGNVLETTVDSHKQGSLNTDPDNRDSGNIDLSNQGHADEETISVVPPNFNAGNVSQMLYPHPHENQQKGNVVGYIDNNFPVILLDQNEIR